MMGLSGNERISPIGLAAMPLCQIV